MFKREGGAAAVFVASVLILLVGVAAVALDISAGFNERNQNQNAGDNGVMAGAIEKADPSPDDQAIVTEALQIVQANLTADFPGGMTDATWIAMWRACTDDGNPGWQPLPEPIAWGGSGATLDCVSQTGALLRVRVPDQLVGTTFGSVIGFDSIATNAVSIAKLALMTGGPPIVPFGVDSGADAGEFCLSSASNGNAFPPCEGSQTGSFGPIISPLFGTFGDHMPECNGNTLRWFERNLVWGLDHPIEEYPGAIPNAPWSQETFNSLPDTKRDACTEFEGIAIEVDGFPINSVNVDTGFPNPEMTNALVSNQEFDGRKARLQQWDAGDATRIAMDKNTEWELDNTGPWKYLDNDSTDPAQCQKDTYDVSQGLTTEQKVEMFEQCLDAIEAGGSAEGTEVFTTAIMDSPRFVWAPQFGLGDPPGSKFTPIREFWPVFLGGVWFNCPNPNSGQPCGATFFPDEDESGILCDGIFPSCKQLSVNQVSAWLLPATAVPQAVRDAFDDRYEDLEPQLFQ